MMLTPHSSDSVSSVHEFRKLCLLCLFMAAEADCKKVRFATEALTLLSWRVARTELSRLDSDPTA